MAHASIMESRQTLNEGVELTQTPISSDAEAMIDAQIAVP